MPLPGWDSLPATSAYARLFTYLGFGALFLLGVFEVIAHVYNVHETTLKDLELETLRQPRRLAEEQRQRIGEILRPFVGHKFSFNVYPDAESITLATEIDAALKSAGWERIESQVGDLVLTVGGATAGQTASSGVIAYVGPEDDVSIPALRALGAALTAEGIDCAIHKTEQLKGKVPPAIMIVVGSKHT